MPDTVHRAVVAFGSNLGNRSKTIDLALSRLGAAPNKLIKRSDYFETDAWIHPDDDATEHPRFLNGVAILDTPRTAEALLRHLLEIEQSLGRRRGVDIKPWQPRSIDLDLIAMDDLILDLPALKLPHPRMHERDFVLRPLVQIWPDWQHPILEKSADSLLAELV